MALCLVSFNSDNQTIKNLLLEITFNSEFCKIKISRFIYERSVSLVCLSLH